MILKSLSKTPFFCQVWKRSCKVLLDTWNQSRLTAFHWQPLHRTYQTPLITSRLLTLGLPGPISLRPFGRCSWASSTVLEAIDGNLLSSFLCYPYSKRRLSLENFCFGELSFNRWRLFFQPLPNFRIGSKLNIPIDVKILRCHPGSVVLCFVLTIHL